MIKIRDITIDVIGPFDRRQNYKLGMINLFYGKNETGKSYLVRALLGAVFRAEKNNKYVLDGAKALVDFADSNSAEFTSKSKNTIEQHLTGAADNVINDLSRLCVVPEGNLTLDPKLRNNINVEALRGYFSDTKLRDRLQEEISATIQKAKIERIGPAGDNKGEITQLNTAKDRLKNLDAYLEKVNRSYADAQLQGYDQKIEKINDQIQTMNIAKQAKAWKLFQELHIVNAFLDRHSVDTVNSARNEISILKSLSAEKYQLDQKIEADKDIPAQLAWLTTAERELLQANNVDMPYLSRPLMISIAVLFLGMLTAIILEERVLALVLSVLLFGILVFSLYLQNRSTEQILLADQHKKIYHDFSLRTGVKNPTIVDIKTKLKALEKEIFELDFDKKKSITLQQDIKSSQVKLNGLLIELSIQRSDDLDEADRALLSLRGKINQTQNDQIELNKQLSALSIPDDEIMDVHSGIPYSKAFEKNLIEEKTILENKRANLLADHENFLNEGGRLLGETEKLSWNDTLDHIRKFRGDLVAEIKNLSAKIMAKIVIHQYLTDQIELEDETIRKALSSSSINDYIKTFTNRYESITYEDDEIVLNPGPLRLDALSTGTREQILLAIRFGILQHHLGNQQMFIILDDAFQHSDWERRERLVDSLGEMASRGWQILYFTMDDHIKTLFENRLKTRFDDDYKLFDLSQE